MPLGLHRKCDPVVVLWDFSQHQLPLLRLTQCGVILKVHGTIHPQSYGFILVRRVLVCGFHLPLILHNQVHTVFHSRIT